MVRFHEPAEEARAIWVEALRSGKYEQTCKSLLRPNGSGRYVYCCLGVACQLFADRYPSLKLATNYGFEDECGFYDEYLPKQVQNWLGLTADTGTIKIAMQALLRVNSLSEFNDKGATFEQIADLIEQGFVYVQPNKQESTNVGAKATQDGGSGANESNNIVTTTNGSVSAGDSSTASDPNTSTT